MKLPAYAQYCISALEQAGFSAYAVGGCVRDALLGLTPKDYDLCTNATPEETKSVFKNCPLVLNGLKHGTVGVIFEKEVVEITTFRREGGYADSRHPDWVEFVGDIEEDLARRDFTVNAMAYNPAVGYVDPFGGQADLENRVLRAVGDPRQRFTEDALRILRGVRFAVTYGLTPEENTLQAMNLLIPNMETLARERVFVELCKLITKISAKELLLYAPILSGVMPELADCVGFSQHSPHHAYDVYTHTAYVVEGVPEQLSLKWAALLHDIGKPAVFYRDENGRGHFPDHASVSAEKADALLFRLKAPTALREQVVFLVSHHMTPLPPDRRILRRRRSAYGKDNVQLLLALQKADWGGKGVSEDAEFLETQKILEEIYEEDGCLKLSDLAVSGKDLLALGYPADRRLGVALNRLLGMVLDEKLPNSRDALLEQAERMKKSC